MDLQVGVLSYPGVADPGRPSERQNSRQSSAPHSFLILQSTPMPTERRCHYKPMVVNSRSSTTPTTNSFLQDDSTSSNTIVDYKEYKRCIGRVS